VLEHFLTDEKYLKNVFIHTEQLWESQFQQIKKIYFVLLGEAPFYGCRESYFYNESSNYTEFFRHEVYPIIKRTSLSKNALFKHLRENGFIIVDIFPFTFNNKTAIQFRNRDLLNLFCAFYEHYFKPKLEKIKTKSTEKTSFSLRYRRHRVLSDIITIHLKALEFLLNETKLGCIGSNNIPLDVEKFEIEYRKTINNL